MMKQENLISRRSGGVENRGKRANSGCIRIDTFCFKFFNFWPLHEGALIRRWLLKDEKPVKNTAESARLEALYNLDLLDTPVSESFDRITRMASQIFSLPISAVSLTDVDRQWFKSRVGVEHQAIPRDGAPCAQVAESADMLVIPDMADDACYRDSVLGKSGIRFYAGAPLITRDGYGLGALCVLGTDPRSTTEQEMSSLRDLAAMVMSQIELQHAFGRVDPISGLPNRTQFLDDIADLGREQSNGSHRLAVLVDLAETKQIDHLSRVMGPSQVDTSVREAGRILRSALARKQTAYHISPTQFAFLAPKNAKEIKYFIKLRKILALMEEASSLRFLMTPVIGVAPFAPEDIQPADLLRAMNSAAQDARSKDGNISVFSVVSDDKHRRAFQILQDFGPALLADDQLSVVFQPRMDMPTGQCIGAEVLLRWHHPELGHLSPGEFIPIIEHSPHVKEMTIRVLDEALHQVNLWKDRGIKIPMSVNISAANLEEEDFVERVMLALLRHGVRPAMLELEVTESAVMKDTGNAQAKLLALSDAGIRLSIDDFGTGYSSLAYLQKLPTTIVKLDQSFIRNLGTHERENSLVRSMITLSHDLGYRVVAEGVETKQVSNILSNMGCDEAQGYLFAKPMAAHAFEEWIGVELERKENAA